MSFPPPNQKRVQERAQKLKQIFLVLVVIGLVVGGVASVGIVAMMRRLGLTDQPQIEQQ